MRRKDKENVSQQLSSVHILVGFNNKSVNFLTGLLKRNCNRKAILRYIGGLKVVFCKCVPQCDNRTGLLFAKGRGLHWEISKEISHCPLINKLFCI